MPVLDAVLYFPPRFASRNSTFFLTDAIVRLSKPHFGANYVCLSLTDWVVLEHAERAVGTRAAEGHEEARHGHGHEAHGDRS